MEFSKENRSAIDEQAVVITGFTEGKKGRVVFKMPTFALKPASDATNAVAKDFDKTLQAYLDSYLKRTKREQVETVAQHVRDEDMNRQTPPDDEHDGVTLVNDDSEPF